jgi:phenylalanyl-tRNA synthetase beta chain
MKFTLPWLKEHLETEATADEIARTLTALGLEVEDVHDRTGELAAFSVARVIEAVQHPNADRLRLCTVETAAGRDAGGLRRAQRDEPGSMASLHPPAAPSRRPAWC